MILSENRYNRYHLVTEMYEAIDYIRNHNNTPAKELISELPPDMPIILTGEGSSRIFPAKNTVHHRLMYGGGPLFMTESSTDLAGMNLEKFVVIGASNSGRTKELINLFKKLKDSGHKHLYGLTCNAGSLLEKYTTRTSIIDAGKEKAVAATKSVVAQALYYDALLTGSQSKYEIQKALLAKAFEQALNEPVKKEITGLVNKAQTVYFSGNNNGVAEELVLKTNEIIRKRSSYLPGTYLLHGVEEVISSKDVIIMVDAYPDEFNKVRSVYTEGIGTPVITLSSGSTPFHTLTIPDAGPVMEPYIKLAAGWNLLVESGIELGIDLDKPERARKIGNEAAG